MILRGFLIIYRIAWTILLPVVLIYLWRRGRRDPLYRAHLRERFALYDRDLPQDAIWFHAVSLGEVRSAITLIRMVLARGDGVVVTCFTPAGRREAESQFADAIETGQLAVVWAPFDMWTCYRRFFRACRPRIGLPLEVEVWPAMIFAGRAAGIPIYMCNGQYGSAPLTRDSKGLRIRQRLMRGLSGVFVKSDLQAERFESVGVSNIHVTGELRFDQPIPGELLRAAEAFGQSDALAGREVIAIASGVAGEEELFGYVIEQMRHDTMPPVFIYVPRAPERFDAVANRLTGLGLRVARRSEVLPRDLSKAEATTEAFDVLLGDSLGEMYFYLALANRVVVGGGFLPQGSHNIIEPLALGKYTLTGPETWVIEFPFLEAETAGVAKSVKDRADLLAHLRAPIDDRGEAIQNFTQQHRGASARTLAAIDRVIGP